MSIEFNHTIVNVTDKQSSANFWAKILGLPSPTSAGYFLVLKTSNSVSLDFIDSDEKIELQHYAFKVSEKEFDEIFERIKSMGLIYWADPTGHLLEVLTWD